MGILCSFLPLFWYWDFLVRCLLPVAIVGGRGEKWIAADRSMRTRWERGWFVRRGVSHDD